MSESKFKFSLRQLALELKEELGNKTDEDNFSNEVNRKFNDILDVMNIDSETIKQNGEFNISHDDADFVKYALKNYTNINFQQMRKNNFEEAEYKFVQTMVAGFDKLLKKSCHDQTTYENQLIRIYNRTDFPLLKEQNTVYDIQSKIHKFVCDIDRREWSDDVTKQDNIVMLKSLKIELEKTLRKWEEIFSGVADIRDGERSEYVDKCYELDKDDKEKFQEDMKQTEMFYTINKYLLSNSAEYKKVIDDLEELMTKDDYMKRLQKEYDKLYNLRTEMYETAKKQLYPNESNTENQKIPWKSNDLQFIRRNSLDVLREAYSDYQESIKKNE